MMTCGAVTGSHTCDSEHGHEGRHHSRSRETRSGHFYWNAVTTAAFPKKWRDCPEFVECLKARGYVLDIDRSLAMSPGLYLYMYELWQDGKRGS